MLSLRSAQLLNQSRKLFGIIRQHRACVCVHLRIGACKPIFAVLPFAACATLTIHVICMRLCHALCVLSAACVLSLV